MKIKILKYALFTTGLIVVLIGIIWDNDLVALIGSLFLISPIIVSDLLYHKRHNS